MADVTVTVNEQTTPITITVTPPGEPAVTVGVTEQNDSITLTVGPQIGEQGPQGEKGDKGDYFGVSGVSFTSAKDVNGRLATRTYANGTVITYNRNAQGVLLSKSSNIGKTETLVRDGQGNVTGKNYT